MLPAGCEKRRAEGQLQKVVERKTASCLRKFKQKIILLLHGTTVPHKLWCGATNMYSAMIDFMHVKM